LIEYSHIERSNRWKRDYSSVDAYRRSVMLNRARFLEMMGGWHWHRTAELNPQLRRIAETDSYAVDEVRIRAFQYTPPVENNPLTPLLPLTTPLPPFIKGDKGGRGVVGENAEPLDVNVGGILLIPKDSKGLTEGDTEAIGVPGFEIPTYPERKPAVIAQHGLTGSPETVCGLTAEDDAYHAFGATLAEAGYVVFAPRMVTFADKRQRLYRKSMLMGQRLIGLEMFNISRVVDYLQTLPDVDFERIGIYGLSQGGQTALWASAIEERIAATVVSGFFNQRTDKMVKKSPHYTAYIDTNEEDKHYFRQLLEFSDSDIGSLICPRPIFIEAGTNDGAVWVEMAKQEFEKLRYHYEQLGMEDKVEMGIFEGGHEIRAIESLAFLDRWLNPGE
jgi:dienelactone hydrolase